MKCKEDEKARKLYPQKNQCMKEWQGNRILQSCILAYISSQEKLDNLQIFISGFQNVVKKIYKDD
jgi:hypothetical protein